MLKNLKIFSIPEGDWEALYVDGKLVYENHKVRIYDIKDYLPIGTLEEIYISNFDSDKHRFPKTIEEFAKYKWKFEV